MRFNYTDMTYNRLFVEKKEGFRVEAANLLAEFNESLSLKLTSLRLLNVYDLTGFTDALLDRCRYGVFGEVVTDTVTDEFPLDGVKCIAVEYLPGQFDQRAASAVDCVHLIDPSAEVEIRSARLLVFDAGVSDSDLDKISRYFINPVECRRKSMETVPQTEKAAVRRMEDLSGFTSMDREACADFCRSHSLAMNADDLMEVVRYFTSIRRDPTETELRILDTYWSDHCRHTTFTTNLTSIRIDDSFIREDIESTLGRFHDIRASLGREGKDLCLMELATIGARHLRSIGKLDDLEQSEENNACSIFIDVDVDGRSEKWLLQFKNETHNHPTEIEPFGGAATCLGGAIRDPLSGRAYVYQAMRVTGAGDILRSVADTIPGKLPQKTISRKAAAGYSSYGNQIGLATTHVREIYDEGYTAKRLEVGAVVGAVKASGVRRESPVAGDVILLLGGRTGRDGIGGATGSSKGHTEGSLETCGSEVQKGNAPEERKIQRLFRRPEATRMIKKSNDFGAGGVSVAIGELADGLDIRLDRVPVKYSGLNSTELAISESQERMAVVVSAADREAFERLCSLDNIEVNHVADVTDTGRMRMFDGGVKVCDLARNFIDSAGARHYAEACIQAVEDCDPFVSVPEGEDTAGRMANLMGSANVASQKGLVEMFDSTIGRSTVLMPYGGKNQMTETQVSAQKLPVDGYTDTASVMAFGYSPRISRWSPYHGAAYAVVEACTKVAASGADWSSMRFSFQEYFERMTSDPHSWGKPLSALLGALKMQLDLGLPAIGGKDSMSGTFERISVPPTLIAFGITTADARCLISPEFKKAGNLIYIIRHRPLANRMPDVDSLKANWNCVRGLIGSGKVVSAWAIGCGGVAEAVAKMSFGNSLGADISLSERDLYAFDCGSMVVEATSEIDFPAAQFIGRVTSSHDITVCGEKVSGASLLEVWEGRYSRVYPARVAPAFDEPVPDVERKPSDVKNMTYAGQPVQTPVVCMPVFPGTNCDYDTAKAFRRAGAEVSPFIFRNLTAEDVEESISELSERIGKSHILALCGGFSCGDEPDGSGKFIAGVLNNERVSAAITSLLERGGLILGICNGFQALVKSGLLPYGRFGCLGAQSPTLFRNDINRHISHLVRTEAVSVASPWLRGMKPGDVHSIAVSHGEGKFVVNPSLAAELFANGQVAFRYLDNPNGSHYDIEGVLSPDGHILGKMGHSERFEENVFINVPGNHSQRLFENAVSYFRKEN